MLVSLLTWAIFGFFVIAWSFVLVPPAARLLRGVIRPSDTIGSFQQKMSLLGGSSPAGIAPGPTSVETPNGPVLDLRAHRVQRGSTERSAAARSAAQRRASRKRRRDIFTGLLGATGVSLVMALAVGGAMWLAFVAYTALLWQLQQSVLERTHKVAYLHDEAHGSRPEQVRALQRAGSGGR